MSEENLMYKVSSLYYEDNLTQQQIASQLGISRIKVSRILQNAKARGIVEITLKKPKESFSAEENRLAKKWKLKEVVLAPSVKESKEGQLNALGRTAAAYAGRILNGNETISLSWGGTLSSFIDNLPKMDFKDIRIIQMIGGLGSPDAEVYGSDLVRRMADRTGGKGRILSAPGVVSSLNVKKGLLENPHIKETLSLAASADIAFVGIGTASPDSILVSRGEILPADALSELKEKGAAGDISLRFFDESGKFINHSIDEKIIGISVSEIKSIPRVVAVAGGKEKYYAVKGALNSGLVDVLITDFNTGQKLLEES